MMTINDYYYMLDMNGHLTDSIKRAVYIFIKNETSFLHFCADQGVSTPPEINEAGMWVYSETMNQFIDVIAAYEVVQIDRWMDDNGDKAEFYEKLEGK